MGQIAQDLDTFRMPVSLKIETEGNPEDKRVEVIGTSKARRSLPGWELVERDGPADNPRVIRLVPRDLRDAAANRDET